VPILVYHQVTATEGRGGYPWRVSARAFSEQMQWLADTGATVLSLDDSLRVLDGAAFPPRPVVLTFDDGFHGVQLHAWPVLKRHGFLASLFLATGSVGARDFPWVRPWLTRVDDPEEYRPLTWAEVRAFDAAVIALGSHTVTHPHLARLPRRTTEWEVTESRRHIVAETGVEPSCFAYPGGIAAYGDHSDETRAVVRGAGYVAAAVSEIGRNRRGADHYRLRRLSVGPEDSIDIFRAKLAGAWTWTRLGQWAASRVFADPTHY
jgi:peptidoglycan/xylan/chitin deacetylase (PgdA/CDA1 family)